MWTGSLHSNLCIFTNILAHLTGGSYMWWNRLLQLKNWEKHGSNGERSRIYFLIEMNKNFSLMSLIGYKTSFTTSKSETIIKQDHSWALEMKN